MAWRRRQSPGGATLYVSTGNGATTTNKVMQLADTAGYNATISITTASNITLYTAAAGTIVKGVALGPAGATPDRDHDRHHLDHPAVTDKRRHCHVHRHRHGCGRCHGPRRWQVEFRNGGATGTLLATATTATPSGLVSTFTIASTTVPAGMYSNIQAFYIAGTGFAASSSSAFGATLTITAGAATHLAFSVQPATTVAGVALSPSVVVQILDAGNNVVTGNTSSVTLAIGTNAGGGTLSGSLIVSAVAGIATFSNLSIDKTGTGYTLSASDGALSGATSSAFNIIPGAASKLGFGTQPSNTVAGQLVTPAVTVQVLDSFGNVVTGNSSSVTVFLGSNPGSGNLSGTLTIPAVNGVATFANLSIDKTGAGYTLTATDAGLTKATSVGFNITPALTRTTSPFSSSRRTPPSAWPSARRSPCVCWISSATW